MITIAVDAMGGDEGPTVVLQSLSPLLHAFPNLSIRIFCTPDTHQKAPGSLIRHRRVQWVMTSTVVAQDEWPASVLRTKQNSTMGLALKAVAGGEVDACVTSGNTGALVALSKYLVGLQPGLDRPALGTWLPSLDGQHLLLDIGANLHCDAELMLQFALMGAVVAEQVLGNPSPRIALLNVGTEIQKGGDRLQAVHSALMRPELQLNYVGYVEGHDLFADKADVILCDGFVGNISIKACEGLLDFIQQSVLKSNASNIKAKWTAKLLSPFLKKAFRALDAPKSKGAVMLGLVKPVVKSHGRSKSDDWASAIQYAYHEVQSQVASKVAQRLANWGPM